MVMTRMPARATPCGDDRLPAWGRAVFLLMALAAAPCAGAAGPLRVLFVGNSYTYTNDLPRIVVAVAAARGSEVEAGDLTAPNAAIEDHVLNGALSSRLVEGWDWVILQQGPSSQPDSRVHLRRWASEAADLARAAGARVALMSVWPALQNAHTWRDAELSYRLAAGDARACVVPVATAWRLAREQAQGPSLYLPDRLHPTPEGSLLAALVIVRGLRGGALQPTAPALAGRLPDKRWRIGQAQVDMLDALAIDALAKEPGRCFLDKGLRAQPQQQER
jgi:hypothetical protein